MLFQSQDENFSNMETTSHTRGYEGVGGLSPARKKNKGRTHIAYNNSNSNSQFSLMETKRNDDLVPEYAYPLMGVISQDSNFSLSQFSQDFADRLGKMQVNHEINQDQNSLPFPLNNNNSNINANSNLVLTQPDDCFSLHSNWKNNEDKFTLPAVPLNRTMAMSKKSNFTAAEERNGFYRTGSNSSTFGNSQNQCPNTQLKSCKKPAGAVMEPEKQIDLRPVHRNPFITLQNHPTEYYFQKFSSSKNAGGGNNNQLKGYKPQKLWVGAFKDRPRYFTDFEEVALLGEGTFSKVFAVRHRLDGLLYAVKKIQERINSEKHENLLLKEIGSLSYLNSLQCPNIIQYYSSWIYDDQLFLQVELCALGNLEDLISAKPSRTSIVRATLINVFNQHSLSQSNDANNDYNNSGSNNIYRADSYTSVEQGSQTNFLTQPAFSQNNNATNNNNNQQGSAAIDVVEKGIEEELAWIILRDLSKTLDFMHKRDLVHLDIRPANIFLQTNHHHHYPSSNAFSLISSSLSTAASASQEICLEPSTICQFPQQAQVALPQQQSSYSSQSTTSTTSSLFANILAAKPLIDQNHNSLSRTASLNSNQSSSSKAQVYLSMRERIEKMIIHSQYLLKLGDFGHCRSIHDSSIIIEGETRYCPRELIDSDVQSIQLKKCDLFSLGASVYELCLGRFLGCENPSNGMNDDDDHYHEDSNSQSFQSDSQLGIDEWHSLRDGKLHASFLNHGYSQEFISVIQRLLHSNPANRPSAEEVFQMSSSYLLQKTMERQQLPQKPSKTASNTDGNINQEEFIQYLLKENAQLKQDLLSFQKK